ncbi:MAG: hypothetical protein ACFFD8_04540 [Candidatus Thorarchaeota archaeon]
MTNLKRIQRSWQRLFVTTLILYVVGSLFVGIGFVFPNPSYNCPGPYYETTFEGQLEGTLTPSTPNITESLGYCTIIRISWMGALPNCIITITGTTGIVAQISNATYFTEVSFNQLELSFEINNCTIEVLYNYMTETVDLHVLAQRYYPPPPCPPQINIINPLMIGVGIFILILAVFLSIRLYKLTQEMFAV